VCLARRTAQADVVTGGLRTAENRGHLPARIVAQAINEQASGAGRGKRLALAAVIVATATGGSRIAGVARQMLTASVYGVGVQFNTFTSVSAIPNLISQLVADAAVSAAFVPVFTSLLTKGERERAYRLASALLSFMLVVVGAVTVLLIFGAPLVVRLFYPEFTHSAYVDTLAVNLLRILIPTVLIFSVSGVVIGVLYSFERFTMPAVVSIVWNLVIITFIALFSGQHSLGIYALALGTLAGTAAELVMLIVALRSVDFHWRLVFQWRDPLLRHVLVLMLPVTITLGILNFNAVVDFFFAQFVSDHAAAEINYAFRLYQLPQGMFAIAIGTVLFPTMSRFAAANDIERFRETLSVGVRQILFVSLPFIAWFMAIPEAAVRLIYQHGAFVSGDTARVSGVLVFFTLGMAFSNANIMFNRGFQSLQRPWLPLYVGLINLGLNALLDWALYPSLGARGIVLSTSLVSAFNFVALLLLMRRQIRRVDGRRIVVASAKIGLAGAVLAGSSFAVWHALHGFAQTGLGPLLVAVVAAYGVGAAAYLATAKLIGVEELSVVRLLVRRRAVAPVTGPDDA